MAEQRQPRRNKRRRGEFDRGDRAARREEEKARALSEWIPKTEAGKRVKSGEITSLDELFARGYRIVEPEIVDVLVPDIKDQLVDFKKTARVTRQGRNFSFRASVLIGDGSSYIGIGMAKDKEKFPAINKATRNAKLNLKKVNKGCGSWECRCHENHSVPFVVHGSSSSVNVELSPAPKGTGLVVGDKIKDVMRFAGVKDVWSKTKGNTGSTLDFVQAAIKALSSTNRVRLSQDFSAKMEARR